MSGTRRDYLAGAFFFALVLVVFFIDILGFPGILLPGPPYGTVALLAAFFYGPRLVGAVAVWSVLVHSFAYWLQGPYDSWTSILVVLGTALISGLSAALARQREREATLRREAEAERLRADEAAAVAQRQAAELDAANHKLEVERGRLEAIQYITEVAASALPPDEMLRDLLLRLRSVLNADTATILLLDADGQSLRVRASSGLEEEIALGTIVPVGRGVAGRVAAERKPLIVDDLSQVEVLNPVLRQRVRSLVGCPLQAEGRVIGVIHVGTHGPRHFGDDDVRLLQLVADRSAVAIERVGIQAERERLLADVHERAAELEAVIKGVSDGLVVYGPGMTLVRMNEAAERMLGVDAATWGALLAEGRARLLAITTPTGQPLDLADTPVARALRGETVVGHHMVVHRPDGAARHLLSNTGPIVGDQGQVLGAVSNLSDITGIQTLQEQREDFIRTFSHDLRQPLAIILGQAQLLLAALARAGTEGRPRRGLEAIIANANRMSAMIRDLVESLRLEAGQVELRAEPVDAYTLLSEAVARSVAPEQAARVSLDVAEGLPALVADAERIERVLANLIGNALKYSPPESPVRVAAVRQHGRTVISVADQGQGIAPEEVPNLFTRYYRARRTSNVEGLGLGLYVSRLLVEAHGGQIWVESEPQHGSTFSFSLPPAD